MTQAYMYKYVHEGITILRVFVMQKTSSKGLEKGSTALKRKKSLHVIKTRNKDTKESDPKTKHSEFETNHISLQLPLISSSIRPILIVLFA